MLGGARFAVRFVTFLGHVVLALCRARHVSAGISEVDEAVGLFGHVEERWLIADLLRSKGELLLSQKEPGAVQHAEKLFHEALDLARKHGALAWELRAATSLAMLFRDQHRAIEARALLQPVFDQFTEGFDTEDLKRAKALLDSQSS